MQKLHDFLEGYLKKESIFKNKKALQSNYTPKTVPYRGDQINHLAGIMAPCLRMEKPSNVFIYGKVGSGKTLVAKHVTQTMEDIATKNNISLRFIYMNCKLKRVADTEYRLIAEIAREFGIPVPATGLPTGEIFTHFIHELDKKRVILVLILDEVDQLVKKAGDGVLYNLTRLNGELKQAEISLIGISNDLLFIDQIDARVKSSLSEEEMIFPPYDAVQLQKILLQRAKIAFREKVVGEGVIEKCAAYAAREHGDARRALELLRVAGELAERKSNDKISVEFIDEAEDKIERDRVLDTIETQPLQFKLTLQSILNVCDGIEKHVYTGDIFSTYLSLCKTCAVKPLTQRRVGDIIAELDMLGIINARVVSKGRYGRTREIRVALGEEMVSQINSLLSQGLGVK